MEALKFVRSEPVIVADTAAAAAAVATAVQLIFRILCRCLDFIIGDLFSVL